MAETDDYPSTPLRLLLCEALTLVIKHSKLSEAAAKQLLLDFYAETNTPYGYGYQSPDKEFPESRPGRGIDPRRWRGTPGSRRLGIHVVVDWCNNMVTEFRLAPDNPDDSLRPDLIAKALQLVRDWENSTGDEFSPEPVYQIRLVRLYTRDVFAALRWAGLLPPLPSPPQAEPEAAVPPPDAGTSTPSESDAPAAPVISSEQSASPSSDPRPTVKVTRTAWLEAYLTEDCKTELANKYRMVGKAAEAIHEMMQTDPTVESYRSARIIEPYLDGLFPRRRKPK